MEKDSQYVINSRPLELCPQCNGQIDSSRPRLVVDSCGHKKCRMCLILDELGCSLCNDAKKAAAYDAYMGTPFKRKRKKLATESAIPVTNEDLCENTATDSFELGSVIKFSELDDDDNLAEPKLSSERKTERQLDKLGVNCRSGLNSDDAVGQKEVGCLQGSTLVGSKLLESISKDSGVCNSSESARQASENCLAASSQNRQLSDQCEEYFSGIETNPEYGATDTLDAVLLTHDSPIISKEQSESKPSVGAQRKKKKKQTNYDQHITVIPGSPVKYFCAICQKTLSNKRQRKYHSFCNGVKTKPYHCMLCSKAFVSKNHYEYHIRTHAGVRPFSCKICEKPFCEKVKMIRHMMSHTGERPFECKECGKKFVEDCHLKYHLNTHSKEKLYLCSHCGKQFSLILNMRRHELMHEDRQVICELCGKVFSNNWSLILHKKIHSRARPHKCPVCSRTFTYRKDMKRHHNIHTSTRRYKCSLCEVVFTRKDGLVRHIKGIHQDGGRNKKPGDTTENENCNAPNVLDSVADGENETSDKGADNNNASDNVPASQHHPKSLEELLNPPGFTFESENESTSEVKLPRCGRVKGSKNKISEEKKKEEEKKKQKAPRSKDAHPIFRQIIYSNVQVNGNFKQIPVLLTQDKTVRCKEVSVINQPVGNVDSPVVKSSVVQPVTSTSSQCIIHHTSALTTVVPTLPSPVVSSAVKVPGVSAGAAQRSTVPLPKKRHSSSEKNPAKPASVDQKAKRQSSPMVECGVRTITRVPEGLLKPLVRLNQATTAVAKNASESVVSGSNVIQSCGQPSTSKVVHDVHWKKRSVEIAMMKQQQQPPC